MNCFAEYYNEDGALSFHIEYYLNQGQHFADYLLCVEDTEKLTKALSCDNVTDLIKVLTKKYSGNNGIFELFSSCGVEPRLINKGYADTSSDV